MGRVSGDFGSGGMRGLFIEAEKARQEAAFRKSLKRSEPVVTAYNGSVLDFVKDEVKVAVPRDRNLLSPVAKELRVYLNEVLKEGRFLSDDELSKGCYRGRSQEELDLINSKVIRRIELAQAIPIQLKATRHRYVDLGITRGEDGRPTLPKLQDDKKCILNIFEYMKELSRQMDVLADRVDATSFPNASPKDKELVITALRDMPAQIQVFRETCL